MKIAFFTLFAGIVSAGCHPHSTCSSVTAVYTSLYTSLQTQTDLKTDVKKKTDVKTQTNVHKYTSVRTNTGVQKYTSIQTACTSKPGKPADYTCSCHTKGPKTSCIKWTTKPIPTTSCKTTTPKPKCSTKGPCSGTTTVVGPSPKPACPTSKGKGPCSRITTRPAQPPAITTPPCSSKLSSIFAGKPPTATEFKNFWSSAKASKCVPSILAGSSATFSSAYEAAATWVAKAEPTIKAVIEECKKDGITQVKDDNGKVHDLTQGPKYPVFPKTWKGFLESYPSCDGKKNGTWYNGGREGGNPKPTPETPKPTPYAPKPRPNNNGTQYTNPKVPEQFTGGSVQVNGWKTAVVGVVSVLGFFALS